MQKWQIRFLERFGFGLAPEGFGIFANSIDMLLKA